VGQERLKTESDRAAEVMSDDSLLQRLANLAPETGNARLSSVVRRLKEADLSLCQLITDRFDDALYKIDTLLTYFTTRYISDTLS